MENNNAILPKVPRPKEDNKYKCTLSGPKQNQTLRLRLSTLLVLRQKALEAGLSISEMADKLIAGADKKPLLFRS